MVTIRTLDNGIRVALESISYVRSISFGIWVKNGSEMNCRRKTVCRIILSI